MLVKGARWELAEYTERLDIPRGIRRMPSGYCEWRGASRVAESKSIEEHTYAFPVYQYRVNRWEKVGDCGTRLFS